MPIYDFRCQKCETVEEHIAKISETEKKCKSCDSDMKRLITTNFYAQSDMEPYLDGHIGKEPIWIKSRQHRKQVMKREGVYEAVGKGWI